MKRFVEGADRGQSTLLPECLDEWIDESNCVRVIDCFVDSLDLADLGFEGVEPAATGRPAYHPSVLLKLYIYGYLNRVQPSRRLEREAGRNLEVIWLLGRLVPDDKVIADFRKDNGPAIRRVCASFVNLCRQMGLVAKASVAIDGSKFKAVNNRDRNFTRGKIDRRRAHLEESVARYLSQLDTADRQEPSDVLVLKTTRLKEKLDKLKEEMGKLAAYEKQMLASPDGQISLTDPDSRSMATSGRGSGVVGYNVQVAVDTVNHLIVTHEVTNTGSDRSQLANVAREAKAVLQVDKLEAVADRGYFNGEEILACDQAGICVTLPKPMTSGAKSEGRFGKRTSSICRRRTSIAALLARSSNSTMPTRNTGRRCAATGRMPARPARSRISAPQAKNAASRDGSMSTFSKPCSSGWIKIPRPCAAGARRLSIPSARSRCGWARRTS